MMWLPAPADCAKGHSVTQLDACQARNTACLLACHFLLRPCPNECWGFSPPALSCEFAVCYDPRSSLWIKTLVWLHWNSSWLVFQGSPFWCVGLEVSHGFKDYRSRGWCLCNDKLSVFCLYAKSDHIVCASKQLVLHSVVYAVLCL